MEWRRHKYTNFPWNEELQRQIKKQKKQMMFFQIVNDLFFFLLGIFVTVVTISYYPLPWS